MNHPFFFHKILSAVVPGLFIIIITSIINIITVVINITIIIRSSGSPSLSPCPATQLVEINLASEVKAFPGAQDPWTWKGPKGQGDGRQVGPQGENQFCRSARKCWWGPQVGRFRVSSRPAGGAFEAVPMPVPTIGRPTSASCPRTLTCPHCGF